MMSKVLEGEEPSDDVDLDVEIQCEVQNEIQNNMKLNLYDNNHGIRQN